MNIGEANDVQQLLGYVLDQGGNITLARAAAVRLAMRSRQALGAGGIDPELVSLRWPGRLVDVALALDAVPQITTDDDGVHRDAAGNLYDAIEADGELTYIRRK